MLRGEVGAKRTLRIEEIYENVQGEGLLVGTPSIFVRFSGCNLRCPWCDQPSALDFGKKNSSVEEVLHKIRSSPLRHVVITGGEPFAHGELPKLVKALLFEGFSVQIETNGTLWNEELREVISRIHVTCSPKAVANFFVQPPILTNAKELKFVVDEDLNEDVLLREDFREFLRSGRVVLQPEGNRKEMLRKALGLQRALVMKGYTPRIIPQVHKLVGLP